MNAAIIYLAAILSGFALHFMTEFAGFLGSQINSFIDVVAVLVIILFTLALLHLAFRELLSKR